MKERATALAMTGVFMLSAAAYTFGGWAIVTVDDLPEYARAGQPTEISFVVRQHAVTPLNDLSPRVVFKSGSTEISVPARRTSAPGHYAVSLVAPRPGPWSARIYSGFMEAQNALLPIHVVAANAPAPTAQLDGDRGQQLFYAKGCVTCHVRGAAGTEGYKMGPELTGRQYATEVVSRFLADPSSGPLRRARGDQMVMPNLELKSREIASLVAFLNSDAKLSGK